MPAPKPELVQHRYVHRCRLTLPRSCLSNSPTRLSSVGPGGRGGPPCPRNPAGTPDNPSLPKPGSSGIHQKMIAPASTEDSLKRVPPPNSWAPQIPQASPNTPATPKEKSFPGCSCHICLEGRRHSRAAPDPRIPSQPAGPGGWRPVQPLAAQGET